MNRPDTDKRGSETSRNGMERIRPERIGRGAERRQSEMKRNGEEESRVVSNGM